MLAWQISILPIALKAYSTFEDRR